MYKVIWQPIGIDSVNFVKYFKRAKDCLKFMQGLQPKQLIQVEIPHADGVGSYAIGPELG